MKAAIYNPYLDTLGGGERYSMAFGKVLEEAGYKVDVYWKSEAIKEKLQNRFGMDLRGFNFIKDIKRGDGYDVLFWLSDGSIPLLRARRNFLHFQFPFKDVSGRSLMNKMKLYRIERIICNSYFTKDFVDPEYGVESIVIYPPVDIAKIKPKRKENIVLYVGRFSQLTQSKNQDILVDVFKRFFKFNSGWKLVLVGGVEVGAGDFVKRLEKMSKGYPVEIIKSPPFKEIVNLYGKAKFFWSASGFGINENKDPKKVEHFGISLVEAMAAGCVPLVYSAGGHKEIVADGKNGFFWKKASELLRITKNLINDSKKFKEVSLSAQKSAAVYEHERFEAEVLKLL